MTPMGSRWVLMRRRRRLSTTPPRLWDEAEPVRCRRRLGARRRAQLLEDVRDVHAGRPRADEELGRDLAVRLAPRQVLEDLELARRQPELRCGVRKGRARGPLLSRRQVDAG